MSLQAKSDGGQGNRDVLILDFVGFGLWFQLIDDDGQETRPTIPVTSNALMGVGFSGSAPQPQGQPIAVQSMSVGRAKMRVIVEERMKLFL